VSIKLDAALIAGLVDPANEQDRAIAENLITGAVNTALQKAREVAEREMAGAAGEMGLPLPPGGLSGLIS
jgi:DNA-binding protein YbaB